MLLYHFTSREHLRGILASGLGRGIVHVARDRRLNGVWLTTDGGPSGHGLEAGGAFMSDAERVEAREWSGTLPPSGARFPKQADLRITVQLDPRDHNLHEWLPWARRNIDPEWLATLHPVIGGNLKKAKGWRLYFGIIPPEAFVAVEEVPAGSNVAALASAAAGVRV